MNKSEKLARLTYRQKPHVAKCIAAIMREREMHTETGAIDFAVLQILGKIESLRMADQEIAALRESLQIYKQAGEMMAEALKVFLPAAASVFSVQDPQPAPRKKTSKPGRAPDQAYQV